MTVCVVCHAQTSIPPPDGRIKRAEFVSSLIRPGDVGVEIGVAFGTFAYHVLLQAQPSKLYLIDPWEYGLQANVELDPTPQKQMIRDEEYQTVAAIFAPYENVQIIRLKSEEAAPLFKDGSLDYVYIDGEHSFAAVMRDLTDYFPKVKLGGYIIGDDYGWTGIALAVQAFLKMHENEVLFGEDPFAGKTGGQFVIQKVIRRNCNEQ